MYPYTIARSAEPAVLCGSCPMHKVETRANAKGIGKRNGRISVPRRQETVSVVLRAKRERRGLQCKLKVSKTSWREKV